MKIIKIEDTISEDIIAGTVETIKEITGREQGDLTDLEYIAQDFSLWIQDRKIMIKDKYKEIATRPIEQQIETNLSSISNLPQVTIE